ncbi:MAG: hypothetical protein ABJD97_08610 [Betaproteobacteria bacterium]
MKSPNRLCLIGSASLLTLLLAAQAKAAQPCTHDARYERKDGSYISVGMPTESADGLARAHFEQQALGNMVMGAPTVGRLEGELTLTRDSCAGYFTDPAIACTLIITFAGNRAQAYQIGPCYSGAGAYADGIYFKAKERK